MSALGCTSSVAPSELADASLLDARARRRPRWWLEALAIVWLLWVYDAISSLAPLRKTTALDNAHDIWHVERVLHLDPEGALDHWLAAHHTLGLWVSNYYDNAHFVVTFAIVGWLWWRHPDRYRPLRTSLVLINVIGFVVFWLVPLAPPRLLPESHIADVVALTHAFGSWHSGTLASATNANELASMPSLHLAWAMWSAWAVWVVFRRHRLALLAFVHPLITAYAVLATGNHFLVDVVAGVATMVVAMLIADRLNGWARAAARLVLKQAFPPRVGGQGGRSDCCWRCTTAWLR